jgi:alkanesulfonate monooxygenase SsuD/methylene tetrahydromethanopterin reductase-like flavin-dependent oxidoreductase (luciferase family)
MRVGISIGTTFDPADSTRAPRSVLAQADAAVRAGLDSLTVGDRHSLAPSAYLQNVPLIGRILGVWDQRPVGCLFLVPLWHPVLMAEQIGTLAAIAAAPFIIQAGAGDGQAQFAAMGKDLRDRAARTERGIRLVKALLDGETVDDEEWNIKGAHIAPRPAHGTEWWIGGSVQRSIDVEAERVGDSLVDAGYRGFEMGAVAYGDPQSVAEQLAPFGELGFTDIIIRTMTRGEPAVRTVELAGELGAILA